MGIHYRKRIRDAARDVLVARPSVVALVGKTRQGAPRIYSGPAPVLKDSEDFPAISITMLPGSSTDEAGNGVQVQRRDWEMLITMIELGSREYVADKVDELSVEVERCFPRDPSRPGEILGIPLIGWSFLGDVPLEFIEGDHGVIATSQIRYGVEMQLLDGHPDRNPYDR